MAIDEPIMTPMEKSMRLVESDPTPSAANDGDPSVAIIPLTDERVKCDEHVDCNDMDMETDEGPASPASGITHPNRMVLLHRLTES